MRPCNTSAMEHDVLSIGNLSVRCAMPPTKLRQALDAAGVTASMRINGVEYFDAAALKQLSRAGMRRTPGRRSTDSSRVTK